MRQSLPLVIPGGIFGRVSTPTDVLSDIITKNWP